MAVALALVLVAGLTGWVAWICTRAAPPPSPEHLRARAALDRCIAAEAYDLAWETAYVLGSQPDDRFVLCLGGDVVRVYRRVGGIDFDLCTPTDPYTPYAFRDCWTVTWTDAPREGDRVAAIAVARRVPPPTKTPEDSFWLDPYVEALAVRVLANPPGEP